VTYLWLNLIFVAGVLLFWVIAMAAHGRRARRRIASGEVTATPRPGRRMTALLLTLATLLVLTGVFDNVIVGLGIVSYDNAKITGALIGVAPIEDFAYAIAAVFALPALWVLIPAKAPR
jgi:lycopene cyclase domain-containing protein